MAGSAWGNQPVIAPIVVITAGAAGTGLFVYNGTPGAGNLVVSIAGVGGTDPFGNAYGVGVNINTGFLAIAGSLNEFVGAGGNDSFQIFDQGGGGTLANLLSVTTTPNGGPRVNLAPVKLLNPLSQPGAQAGGVMLYGASGQPAYVNPAGQQMNVTGAQLATFPNTTVTAATLTNLASATVLANDAEIGAVFELEVNGNGTWAATTGQTLQLAVALGGTAMSSLTLGATYLAAGTNFRFKVRVRVFCHTTGATGTWSSEVEGELSAFGNNLVGGAGSQNTAGFISCESTGTTTKDTTVNETLALQAAWGATTGAPTLTSRTAIYKRVA